MSAPSGNVQKPGRIQMVWTLDILQCNRLVAPTKVSRLGEITCTANWPDNAGGICQRREQESIGHVTAQLRTFDKNL